MGAQSAYLDRAIAGASKTRRHRLESTSLSKTYVAIEQPTLVDCLRAFNRKERYWLLRDALGGSSADLPLSASFRDRLGKTMGFPIKASAWWAIDYHIDWLFGALVLDRVGEDRTINLANPEGQRDQSAARRLIRGTQEDFDLVIAFDRKIILIEAKGVGSWGNKQIAEKCQRLWEWSEVAENVAPITDDHAAVEIYIVLMSPRASKGLQQLSWPSFVKLDGSLPFFLGLSLAGAPDFFVAPERCDQNGVAKKNGERWHLKRSARPRLDES